MSEMCYTTEILKGFTLQFLGMLPMKPFRLSNFKSFNFSTFMLHSSFHPSFFLLQFFSTFLAYPWPVWGFVLLVNDVGFEHFSTFRVETFPKLFFTFPHSVFTPLTIFNRKGGSLLNIIARASYIYGRNPYRNRFEQCTEQIRWTEPNIHWLMN